MKAELWDLKQVWDLNFLNHRQGQYNPPAGSRGCQSTDRKVTRHAGLSHQQQVAARAWGWGRTKLLLLQQLYLDSRHWRCHGGGSAGVQGPGAVPRLPDFWLRDASNLHSLPKLRSL